MQIEKELLEKIVSESNNRKECFIKLGLHESNTKSYRVLNYWLNEYEIDVSHFSSYNSMKASVARKRKAIKLDDILAGLHPFFSTNHLKLRLIKENRLNHKCAICHLTDWMGQPIPLDLDHINGISTDHRLENIRLLCRNCHAQTFNFCGKNAKRNGQSNHSVKMTEMKAQKLKRKSKNEMKINLIQSSNIQFDKYGWVEKASRLLEMKPQKINRWMKIYMKDFYEEKCFKRCKL